MQRKQWFALVLCVMALIPRATTDNRSFNRYLVHATKVYVELFKAKLSEDTYSLLEDPARNGSAEVAFDQSYGAAWRFKYFFTTVEPAAYHGLEDLQRRMLGYILDFLDTSETVLIELPVPLGYKQCGMVPEKIFPEVIFDLKPLVANIKEQVGRLRGHLDSGLFEAGYDQVKGIKNSCEDYRFYELPLDRFVRGCENDAPEPKTTREAVKCLIGHVARNTNYSEDAMETFKRSIAKYAYLMVQIKGFCFTFTEGVTVKGLNEAENATEQFLHDLRAEIELSDKLPMSNSGTWTCENTAQIPMNKTVVRGVAQSIVNEFKPQLDANGWSGRDNFHKQIVNKTVCELSKNYTGYVFNAIAFLPFDRNDQKCIYKEAAFVSAGYRNLNFFVHYVENSTTSVMETALKTIEGKKSAILDLVFGKGNGDLCRRLKTAIGGDADKFGGIVAVKCGYKFVWYQLAYEYFYAGASSCNGEAAWETDRGSYDANCGQIFFFP